MIEYNSVLRTGESEAGTMIFMIYKWIDNFKINRIQKPESVKNTAICKPAIFEQNIWHYHGSEVPRIVADCPERLNHAIN